ncbi:MAG: cytochrome c oxidase subunit II [Ilumatobacteraceae bacterium]|nr:cytochrome c oxidase subunit II [Ilumatobacteraceae bacterium]
MSLDALLAGLDPPVTSQADETEWVWDIYLYLAIGVAAFIAVLVLYVIIRFRRRDGDELPPQKQYNVPVELAYTIIPLLIIGALFAITVVTVQAIEEIDDDPDLVVEVTAAQWQWQFDYPDSGVSVIGSGEEFPELVLPANSSVTFELQSLDVIHSFWITAFRFKRDIIPGSPGRFSVDIEDVAGYYPNAGVCAEYCGLAHGTMRFEVRILETDEFADWIAQQQAEGSQG